MLEEGSAAARERLVQLIGISSKCPVYQNIVTPKELGVLVPKRKHQRKKTKYLSFAVELGNNYAMYFDSPREPWLDGTYLPEQLTQLHRKIGVCHLTQNGGTLIPPAEVRVLSYEIDCKLRDAALRTEQITAFYNHETGDYDCFAGHDWSSVFTFDHEAGQLSELPVDGFADWFGYRLGLLIS